MKRSQHWSSILLNLILLAGLVAIWAAFAPVKIGGRASYVMINGISMEPNYHTGDLVIIRRQQTYQVGDVATYRDAEMGAYVIHRIIGTEQEKFVLKGDNNSWIDAYQPVHDEIVGKQWLYIPNVGIAMQWLRKPLNMSFTIFLLGGAFMTSMFPKAFNAKNKKVKNSPPPKLGSVFEVALYLLGFLFLGFLGLSIFVYTRPVTRTAQTISYQQNGIYSYSATGTPGVYDSATVRSGEPVFPHLSCFLNIGLDYSITGGQFQNIVGSQQMFARIMDEPSGWQRTIALIPQTAFAGSSNLSNAILDLCQLETLVAMVEKETGLRTNTYTVEIVTNIAFTATASGQAVASTFDPILAFKYDKVHLYLADANSEADPMHITKDGVAGSSNLEANTLSLFGWHPTVRLIRVVALVGLFISFVGLVTLGIFVFNAASAGEDARINLRYGAMLVDVYEKSIEPSANTIDVTSMEDLAKLAERLGSMILHMTSNFVQYYLVQSNGTTYRYVIHAEKKEAAESIPVQAAKQSIPPEIEKAGIPAEVPVHLRSPRRGGNVSAGSNVSPRSIQKGIKQPAVVPQKKQVVHENWVVVDAAPQYVIHSGNIGYVDPQAETEMLRKIKL